MVLVIAPLVAGVVAMLFVSPIAQDQAYHQFADARGWLGIPRFADVVSNLPFLLVGLAGLARLSRFRLLDPRERWLWGVHFACHLLTGLGSAWYHAAPDDARLVWDRLPLTGVILSLVAIVAAERVSVTAGWRLLGPLLATGAASILLWRGDLRLYALVQYGPMLCLPLAILLFPPRYTRGAGYGWAIAWYAAAKVGELLDRPIFEALGGSVSGHTLKHLLAGASAASLLVMVARRRPMGDDSRFLIPGNRPRNA